MITVDNCWTYLDEVADNLDDAIARVIKAKNAGVPLSVGLLGNTAEHGY